MNFVIWKRLVEWVEFFKNFKYAHDDVYCVVYNVNCSRFSHPRGQISTILIHLPISLFLVITQQYVVINVDRSSGQNIFESYLVFNLFQIRRIPWEWHISYQNVKYWKQYNRIQTHKLYFVSFYWLSIYVKDSKI